MARYKSENGLIGAGGVLVNEQQLTEVNNQLTLEPFRLRWKHNRHF